MIKSITLENFFSFGLPVTIELNQNTNVLLGINGSGKSNFLKAIRFLYESIAGKGIEKIFLKDWGGFGAVANFSEMQSENIRISYKFDKNIVKKTVNGRYRFPEDPVYEIIIHKSGTTSYYLEETLFCPKKNEGENPLVFLRMKNGTGMILTVDGNRIQGYSQAEGFDKLFKGQESVLRQISDPTRFLPLFALKSAIESIALYDYFDTSLKSTIRIPGNPGTDTKLLPTGENLIEILHRIKNNHTIQYEKIEALLKNVNPYFKDVNFNVIGSKLIIALREKSLSKTIGVEHISDGTLRFLLLLSILYNPERGSLICLDEPETGLHPDMINMIADSIKQSTPGSQIITATHSPLLLNSFNIEDCLIFEKNINNESIVVHRTEDDFPDWDDDFLTGQLWLSGKIGAKRW